MLKLHAQQVEACIKLLHEVKEGRTIVYLDETLFVPYSMQKESWAKPYENQILHKRATTLKPLAVALCITESVGILEFVMTEKSIKKPDLVVLLEKVHAALPTEDVTIYMDNLRAHHSKEVTSVIEDYN